MHAQIPLAESVSPVEVLRFAPEEWLQLLHYYCGVVRLSP